MKKFWIALCLLLLTSAAWSQGGPNFWEQEPGSMGEGWKGFTDVSFMVNALLTLGLAAVLGAIIAYHPKFIETADTLQEIEAPKVLITYSVIGALIGIMVVKYGLVVGFVLFGIGGLIRFRTVLRSPSLTGTVIFVTLIGLSCGLDLPHVAVLATVFGYVLIYVLNAKLTYRVNVRAVQEGCIKKSATAYRQIFESHGCKILFERKYPGKNRFMFIFRASGNVDKEAIEREFESTIDPSLRGYVDWEVD
jgi:hypothetical protein